MFASALALAGCPKRIGDGCTNNIDCSLNADRLCDLAQPSGYCTISGCEPDRCPDDAMCIEFNANSPRLSSRACMHSCNVDNDCRTGYICTRPIDPACLTMPASFPVCHRLLDTHRSPSLPTGYCVENGGTSSTPADAGHD